MRFEMGLLLEFLSACVALEDCARLKNIKCVLKNNLMIFKPFSYLCMHAAYVTVQAPLPFKLSHTERTIESQSFVFSVYVHIPASSGSKILTAVLAGE